MRSSFFLSFLLIVPVSVGWAQEPPVSSTGGRARILDIFFNPQVADGDGRTGFQDSRIVFKCDSTLTPPPAVTYDLTVTRLVPAPIAVIYAKTETKTVAGGAVIFEVPPPDKNGAGKDVWLTPRSYQADLTVTQGGATGSTTMQFNVEEAGPGLIKIAFPNENPGPGN